MYFGGGLIPFFLLISKLGMYNTRWAMVIPGLVGPWNMIVVRTYIQSNIGEDMLDAVRIDGGGDMVILFRFIYPLCKPVIATITVFTVVGHWNSFFNALLFLEDPKLQPLQLFLRRILIQASNELQRDGMTVLQIAAMEMRRYAQQLRYAAIMVSILPILTVYPFAQKYFIKGVMVGSVKG